jgi:hypothetical protein
MPGVHGKPDRKMVQPASLPPERTASRLVYWMVLVAATTSCAQRWQAAAWPVPNMTAENTNHPSMPAPHNAAGQGSPTKAAATA